VRLRNRGPARGSETKGEIFTDEGYQEDAGLLLRLLRVGRDGHPTEETLKKLKLDFAIADVIKKA